MYFHHIKVLVEVIGRLQVLEIPKKWHGLVFEYLLWLIDNVSSYYRRWLRNTP